MGGEVHGEANTHDEVDHGDAVQVDAPEGHVSDDAYLDAHDADSHPERADGVGDEDQRDDAHDGGGHAGRLDGDGAHIGVLRTQRYGAG